MRNVERYRLQAVRRMRRWLRGAIGRTDGTAVNGLKAPVVTTKGNHEKTPRNHGYVDEGLREWIG